MAHSAPEATENDERREQQLHKASGAEVAMSYILLGVGVSERAREPSEY